MAGMAFKKDVEKLRKRLQDEARQSAFDMLLKLSNKIHAGMTDPYGILLSLQEELELLRDDIQPKLKELVFNTQGIKSESNNLLRAIKDFYHDAEDILDEFNTEVGRRRRLGDDRHSNLEAEEQQLRSSMERTLFPGDFSFSSFQIKIAKRIWDLYSKHRKVMDRKVRFLEKVELMLNYYFAPKSTGTVSSNEKREQHDAMLLPEDFRMVGRDKDSEDIINLILQETEKDVPCVLLVTGKGGIGKTTLVKDIYQDPKVEDHFEECKRWVCMGDNIEFDSNKVREKIGAVRERRFLIVLDDVWNGEQLESQWNKLWDLLTDGAEGSWIIVITRQEEEEVVKKKMGCASVVVKRLHPLVDKDCIQIFESHAFPPAFAESTSTSSSSSSTSSKLLKKIGRKITCEKIKGIPLAAVVVGSSLKDEIHEKVWWEAFSEIEGGESAGIRSALMWCYRRLPTHLKQCFAYWSIFHKDEEVSRSDIIQRWMAHGLLDQYGHDETLEDVGERYLQDLISTSLLARGSIRDEIDESTRVFKMHDLIHDLAMEVSHYKVMGNNFKHFPKQQMAYVRHLSTQDNRPKNASCIEKLWSFTGKYSHINALHNQLKTVRELHISDQRQKKLAIDFTDMVHLRLLDLSDMRKLEFLPESLCHLYNLQTLVLPTHRKEVKLPECMGKLVNLHHIEGGCCKDILRVCRELASLQTARGSFSLFANSGQGLRELQNLKQLRGHLSIDGLSHVEDIGCAGEAQLDQKEGLLSLSFDVGRKEEDNWYSNNVASERERDLLNNLKPPEDLKVLEIKNYGGDELPTWLGGLLNIVDLTLSNCHGLKKLPPLDLVPKLVGLSISKMPDLETLDLQGLTLLKKLKISSLNVKEILLPNCTCTDGSLGNGGCQKLRRASNLVDLELTVLQVERLDLQGLHLLKKLIISVVDVKEILLPNYIKEISIQDCPALKRCMDTDDQLYVFKYIFTDMWETILRRADPRYVRDLCLDRIDFDPEMSSDDRDWLSWWFQNLSSIKQIHLMGIEKGSSFPSFVDLSNLDSLQCLFVEDCPYLRGLQELASSLSRRDIEIFVDGQLLQEKDDVEMQPPKDLKVLRVLEIKYYGGDELPTWMGGLLNIVDLTLSNCHGLKKLPPLAHLYHLKSLTLRALNKMQRISPEVYGIYSRGEKKLFPSLKRLTLEYMSALEEWEGPVIADMENSAVSCFPKLEYLHVDECKKLRRLPLDLVPKLVGLSISKMPDLERLDLQGLTLLKKLKISFVYVKEILLPNCAHTVGSSGNGDCQKLRRGSNLVNLELIQLRVERLDLQGLRLLKKLIISRVDVKEILLPNCIKDISIQDCPALMRCMDTDDQLYVFKYIYTDMWETILRRADPRYVRDLCLDSIDFDPEMSSDDRDWLSWWFRNLSSIKTIHLQGIKKGSTFPSFVDLSNLHSLQYLFAKDCPDLRGLQELASSLSRRDIQIFVDGQLLQEKDDVEMQEDYNLSEWEEIGENISLGSQGHPQVHSECPEQLQVENNDMLNVSSNEKMCKRKRSNSSKVWDYFKKIGKKAKCTLCGKELESDPRIHGTSSLKKHLKHHAVIFKC